MNKPKRKRTGGGIKKSQQEKDVIKNRLYDYCVEDNYDLDKHANAITVQEYIAKELIEMDAKKNHGTFSKYDKCKINGTSNYDYTKIISISKLKEMLPTAIDDNKKPDKLKYIEAVLKNNIKEIKLVEDELKTFTAIKSNFETELDYKVIILYTTPQPPCIDIFYELLYKSFNNSVNYIEKHCGGATIHCNEKIDCIKIKKFISKYR